MGICYNIPTAAYGTTKEHAVDCLVVTLNSTGYSCYYSIHDYIVILNYGYYTVDVLKDGSSDNKWQVGVRYDPIKSNSDYVGSIE